MEDEVVAWAPGRVNLMGDHTDQTGGRVLPMAIDLGTTVRGVRGGPHGDGVRLRSGWTGDSGAVDLIGAVAAQLEPGPSFTGTVDTTLPVGAGLSSSASFTLAVALALGFTGTPLALAQLAQRAEQAATGVPCGIMDQLAGAAGVAGHALRIDCHTSAVEPVPMPEGIDVLVVHSGQHRSLAHTPYASRVADLRAAEAVIGPLRLATEADLAGLADGTLRRRARHVVTENARVDAVADALRRDDRTGLGRLLAESHASLRDDLEVSTEAVDALVDRVGAAPGVIGARLTGAGFGGCIVALAEVETPLPREVHAWRVRAADGATCVEGGRPSWPRTRRR